jgi:hypothetical protein
MSELSATLDVALKAAGNLGINVSAPSVAQQSQSGSPGTEAASLRAELAAGTLTHLHSAGIGAHADHSA